MPMQEDPALVPGQPQRQCRHRVRMVDVDDVIVPAPPAQFRYHCRAQHCAGHFSDGVAENEIRIVIDLLHPGRPFRCGTHHITAYPERRYASGKVIHHFLDATPHGVEFSKLEDSHKKLNVHPYFNNRYINSSQEVTLLPLKSLL